MLRRRKFQVIYPEYFDKNRSRRDGRRVNKSLAMENIALARFSKACQSLGLEIQVEKEKSYPGNWVQHNGRILIAIDKNNKLPKEKLLKDIAKKAKRFVPKKKIIPDHKSEEGTKRQRTKSAKKRKKVKSKT